MASERTIEMTVNGSHCSLSCEPRRLLSEALREDCGLTGTHVGCEQGSCGACTVIVDGQAQRSCLMLAVQADGSSIETIESGAAGTDDGHPVQVAMHQAHGLQCGFCTAGIVMSLVHAYRSGISRQNATREVLNGHLCRCTGYTNIRKAIDAAWAELEDNK